MRKALGVSLIFVLPALLLGCPKSEPEKATPETTARPVEPSNAPVEPPPSPLADHMKEHFSKLDAIEKAVVSGRLEDLSAPADWLADHAASEQLPKGWGPFLGVIQGAANRTREAKTISDAAAGLTAIAAACGGCHAGTTRPKFEPPPMPKKASKADTHMLEHQWAVDRMLEGLVVPSDELWKSGAYAFAKSPLHPGALGADAQTPEPVKALSESAHALGLKAAESEGPGDRQASLAELLKTCAACHALLKPAEP